MSLTYKVICINESKRAFAIDGKPLKELELTDLNSDGSFNITATMIKETEDCQIGIVFDGPENWLGRAVYLFCEDNKPLSTWEEGDRIIDMNPYNK